MNTLSALLRRRSAVLAVLVLVTCFAACNLLLGVEGASTQGAGGLGGGGASSTGSVMSSGPTGSSSSATSNSATSSATSSSASATSSSATSSSSGTVVSREGLVLLLHLDETSWSGAGSVIDSSGQGNHGTAVGTAAGTAAGKFGGAGSFDGKGYVEVPDSPTLHPTNKLTYAAWIYSTMLPSAGGGVISKRTAYATDVAFTLFLWQADTPNFNAYVDLPGRSWSVASFVNGQWYHVAVVYDGAQADETQRGRIYVNGVLDSTVDVPNTTLDPSPASVQVGNLPGGGQGFVGKIDEVAMWLRVLGADEIAALYNATGPL